MRALFERFISSIIEKRPLIVYQLRRPTTVDRFGLYRRGSSFVGRTSAPLVFIMMKYGEDGSPPSVISYPKNLYSSSASSSSASVSADTLFQSTNSAGSNLLPCYMGNLATTFEPANILVSTSWLEKKLPIELAPKQRHHLRRTSARTETPNHHPALVRQSDQKVKFVDALVDSSVQVIEAIWPLSSVAY
ncbi:hypothetical protein BKA64DRAFT_654966 [Cadophora sp. MPI-SDFR-AT-0126]|nr:hypothetical protein BKA64DRAFT_654966 [Leotiomycetes sp. MPI-SDFR-AT-0126]